MTTERARPGRVARLEGRTLARDRDALRRRRPRDRAETVPSRVPSNRIGVVSMNLQHDAFRNR